jgi:molecular chaperone HtpG
MVSLYQGFGFPVPCELSMTTTTAPESQPFQAEVAELLNLMVHSVYSETDIFLRELISNASDACDKLRYEAISAPELIADGAPPKIRIVPDKKANTLSVVDSGIGMDRQELIDNLGTIARSGTKSFLSRLTEAKDGANLMKSRRPARRTPPASSAAPRSSCT